MEKEINSIIQYFNRKTGQKLQFGDKKRNKIISQALELFEETELQDQIDIALTDEENKDIMSCMNSIILGKAKERHNENAGVVKELSLLERAVVDMISKSQTEQIEGKILKELRHTCDSFIKENYGAIQRRVDLVVNDKKVDMSREVLHSCFDTVLKFVSADEPVFLTGPAGCGKNVLCKQIAKALDLPFYFTNAVTQEYKITGFTDAMGIFHETQFYKAFKDGGVFMLDEMDASIPEVLVILNSAIANRYFDFPAPIGFVEAHPNFRIIAAGNTFGLGADIEYVGRNQLDMASLDRFAMVRMSYDKNIEMNLSLNDTELVEFAETFRDACEKAGVKALLSYRAINRIAKLKDSLGEEEALKTCLLKNLGKDDIQMILKETSSSNKYIKVLKKIMEAM